MEKGAQAPDWDSDETVIDGSVTESDLEDEELPWSRLLFDQDTSLRSEFSLHPDISGICKGTCSPEIQLGLKLREDPQKQISKKKTMPVLNEDAVLQQPQDEMEQNQALLEKSCPMFTVSFPEAELSLNHESIQGPKAENPEVLPYPAKELNADRDSPEISLLSGTAIKVSDMVAVKENSLIEPQKILAAPNVFFESGKEVTLTITSEETKDEESSVETFVSALEKLITSPANTQEETLFGIMNDIEPRELMSPLSNSLNSLSIPLTCHRDLLENTKDDALPAELLAAINTLSEATVGPICHRKEGGSSLSAGNECLGIEPNMSQTDDDCAQIAEVNFESLCSTPPYEQDSKLAELQDKHPSVQQTLEDPNPFVLQTLVDQNVISCDPLNNKRNSNPVENSSDQDPPSVLRRSSRIKVGKYTKHKDDMYKIPEKILPTILDCESQAKNSSTETFRMQGTALMIEGKRKNMHSSRLKSEEQIWKNGKIKRQKEKMKMNNIPLSLINRRNIFGENLLYKAALLNDFHLVHQCIEKGGNVNQTSYAGWTALHEASARGFYETASELVKGGADINVKGKDQITPLHDAVMSGHYKVAELLLFSGADPLFRNANGKCALDVAQGIRMRHLLERYVPKHQKHLTSAQKDSTDPLDVEDAPQPKKPKFSSKNCIGFVCDENSNRQKPEHIKVDKGSKKGLFIKKEDVNEHYPRNSKSTKFGNFKHKQSTVNQIYSTGLRKNNLHNVKDSSTNASKYKGRRNEQCKRTQVHKAIQERNSRKTVAVSSSRRSRLVTDQQHILQTLYDLPEESCKPFSPALSSLENGLSNNIDTHSVPKETHTQSLDLLESQEIKSLELESSDQAKAVTFSGLFVHKEIELPIVTTDQQAQTHQEQHHISPYKSHENTNSDEKKEDLNKWENFNNDIHVDCCTSEETITSKKMICSTSCKNHYNDKENITNREVMDFEQSLPSKDHFSQDNKLKAGGLSILPQQEAVHFSNSDNTAVSEPHVANYEQYIYGTSFVHSQDSPEHTSLACTRTISTHDVLQLTNVEQFQRPQDCSSPSVPTSLMNQTNTHIVEKLNKKEGTKRNYTDKGQKQNFSNGPLSTVVHSQVIETTNIEKRRQDLAESEIIHNRDFHSIDNMNKELTNISQVSQREEKEISHKPDEELTNNINGDESTVRNCEEKKDRTDTEIHIPVNIQEQNLSKATCSQEMKRAGINKRNTRGESPLHLAVRRGDLSLMKVLIESGADVNLKDNAGWTPLHKASSEGADDIIVELLRAGANVNCEDLDGILPLHDAVANNHLKAAEILLQHGANTNKKNKKQKTALDEADDEKMRELLKSYGAIEIGNKDESKARVTVKIPTVQSKRHKPCFCDGLKTVDPPSLSHQEKTRESLHMHKTISAILEDIEEKQEILLEFEIRTPEDAEQYTEKMLEIKEIMDNVLAKQKAERDDLAKKYRVSIESFKHGVLREQLANLAMRQKSLLAVAKKQKKISQKIQNYKNVTSVSGLSLRKLPSSSEISCEKDSQELTSLENSVQPQAGSFSPASSVCESIQESQLSLETWNDSQNINTCLNLETVRGEEFSEIKLNSRRNVSDCSLDEFSESRPSDGTKKIKLPSQSVAFIAQAEYLQKENDLTTHTAKGHESYSPSALTGPFNTSETTSVLVPNAHSSTGICGQTLSNYDPKRGNKRTASQQPPRRASETLTHQDIDDLGSDMGHQMKPYLKNSAFALPYANDSQSTTSSGSGPQHTAKKPLNYSTAPKKKRMQIKDLIALGRINPGNNILEFKTQETTHKASVLLSGKIKVENGQIYQNPVTWLKDLLGGDSHVTWNYAWSKVTYLGKELLKCVSEEVPIPPEPNLVPQQHQPCLPGTSSESMQSIPHYLQINEILLISDREYLPCHIMDQHWKFYVECEELTF
ncbi:PREDICTED: putative ankyrin repeat domain-containing protein 31 [Myotis brandtii]|uniref:putative ankyrin repeat domain-containing protein 31 n=1 Tax=Myotis brandtii TaxID=109478 RepID=UPI000703D54B|nr:PREDICTED: putative ankyrin repeat domain-containing protein 31 [Myotis brandtii]